MLLNTETMILNMNSIGYRDFVKIHSDNVKDEIQH